MASFAAWRRDGPTVDTIAWLLDLFIADRQLGVLIRAWSFHSHSADPQQLPVRCP
jgi:hypothetical protein